MTRTTAAQVSKLDDSSHAIDSQLKLARFVEFVQIGCKQGPRCKTKTKKQLI